VRILVVDDSAAIRARVAAMLVDVPGVEVLEASGADEAIEIVGGRTVDFVVLDLSMPDRSGLEALAEIKRRPHPPTVIIMTNHSTSHHRRQCLARGADAFLDKSRDFDELLAIARRGRI
jgi:CheY-like chemotaxis protein